MEVDILKCSKSKIGEGEVLARSWRGYSDLENLVLHYSTYHTIYVIKR